MSDKRPYFVEVDHKGCNACHAERTWGVATIGANGKLEFLLGESWGDEEHALDICNWLNDAFEAGFEKAKPAGRVQKR